MAIINPKIQLFVQPLTTTWTVLTSPSDCSFIEVTGTAEWDWRSDTNPSAATRRVGTLQPHLLAENVPLAKGESVVEVRGTQSGLLYIKVLQLRK